MLVCISCTSDCSCLTGLTLPVYRLQLQLSMSRSPPLSRRRGSTCSGHSPAGRRTPSSSLSPSLSTPTQSYPPSVQTSLLSVLLHLLRTFPCWPSFSVLFPLPLPSLFPPSALSSLCPDVAALRAAPPAPDLPLLAVALRPLPGAPGRPRHRPRALRPLRLVGGAHSVVPSHHVIARRRLRLARRHVLVGHQFRLAGAERRVRSGGRRGGGASRPAARHPARPHPLAG